MAGIPVYYIHPITAKSSQEAVSLIFEFYAVSPAQIWEFGLFWICELPPTQIWESGAAGSWQLLPTQI